uniref:Uncharacterized protein n=1 Tax=Oryza rufipogon TaxID=4529 RepID=A0A0E0QHU0_ORYRU
MATPPGRKRRPQASMSLILGDQTRLDSLKSTARPKSPDYRQTEPPTQTNTTPQPPKGSTAGSGDGQKKGGAPKTEGGLARLERN